jgi:hypothetical protein
LETGILLSIFGLVATIIFGIVGVLVIRNHLAQRQKAPGAHSTAIQSGRDTMNAPGSTIIINNTTLDVNPDELHNIARLWTNAIVLTLLLFGISIFCIWDKSQPIEFQQTLLSELAVPAIGFLLVTVSILWVWLFVKTRY